MRVCHIYISPGHNYFGNYGKPAGENPIVEVPEVECVQDYGLKGDRFYGYRPDYKGQITFFDENVFEEVRREFKVPELSPAAFRRNVITAGLELNTLIGTKFTLQGIEFAATEECRPCHWMEQAVAKGAEDWLKGRGGLRCRILSTGVLRRDV